MYDLLLSLLLLMFVCVCVCAALHVRAENCAFYFVSVFKESKCASSSGYCRFSLHILLMFWFLFANMIIWWYTRFDVIHHITLQQPVCSCPRLFHCYDNNNDSIKDSSRKSRNRRKNCVQSDDNVAHMQTKLNAHKTPCFVIGIESWTKQNKTKQIKESKKKQHTHT